MTRLIGTWQLPPGPSGNNPLRVPGVRVRSTAAGLLVQLTRDMKAVPDGASPWTVTATGGCILNGTSNLYLDRAFAYMVFGVPGDPQLYAIEQSAWPAFAAGTDALPLAWVDSHDALTPRLGALAFPPVTPILIITSGDGGSSFARMFFASTFTMHLHFFAGTMTISMYWFNFGANGSIPHRPDSTASTTNNVPEENSLGYFSAIYPPSGTDWKLTNFATHAAAGDNWPLPGSYADMVAGGNNFAGLVTEWMSEIIAWWPFWRAATQGFIDDNGHFDATNTWDSHPPDPVGFLDTNTGATGTTPGTLPATIAEDVLIRGNLSAVAVPAGATMTRITFFQHVDDHCNTDFAFFNDAPFFYPGLGPNTPVPGDFPTSGIPVDVSTQFVPFGGSIAINIPGNNLFSMLATGEYQDPTNGNHTKASAYVDFAIGFTTVAHYVDAPSGWQTGGGGEFVADALVSAPAWFPSATQGSDLSTGVGVDGRAYFVSNLFSVPGSFSVCVLKITAETGIGEIDINGTLIATRSETVDLWTSHTILTYTISPADFTAGLTNLLAVQCYSTTGTCQVFYSLSFFP